MPHGRKSNAYCGLAEFERSHDIRIEGMVETGTDEAYILFTNCKYAHRFLLLNQLSESFQRSWRNFAIPWETSHESTIGGLRTKGTI
jgi:hypothetical protein